MSCLLKKFKEYYGIEATTSVVAPGRLEVLGNHTDYNEGLVLSAAVAQKTEFALAPVKGNICKIHDFRDNSTHEFDLNDIDKPKGNWTDYVIGVIVGLKKKQIKISAFYAGILSDIPLSAGMSSSAALEVSTAFALAKEFNIELSKLEWAKICQSVEYDYLGLKCGLLDQLSSIYGKKNNLIFSDFREEKVMENIPLNENFVFVVANSLVKHNLVDSAYNQRREACENVVNIIQQTEKIKSLRDVSVDMLELYKDKLPRFDYLRAMHVVLEIQNVRDGILALKNNDINAFGQLMYKSHQSSVENFENSCEELDCLVELSKSIPGCIGARLSGGGFGGVSIHLVKKEEIATYAERLQIAYELQTGKKTEIIICEIGDGAS